MPEPCEPWDPGVTYVIGRNRKVRLAFHSELDMDAHSAQACLALAEQAPSA